MGRPKFPLTPSLSEFRNTYHLIVEPERAAMLASRPDKGPDVSSTRHADDLTIGPRMGIL